MLNIDNTIVRIQHKIKRKNLEINPVIDIERINQFEQNTKLMLPNILKRFYTEICNGCKMIDGFYLRRFNELKIDFDEANENFNFTDYWVWETEDVSEIQLKVTLYGNIELIDIGDGQTWNIIVNGSEEGQMWFFTDVGIQPCAPRRDLLSWFEFWLDGNEDYFEDFVY